MICYDCSFLSETRFDVQAADMTKDISKYLYKCNSDKVDLTHLENYDQLKEYLEAFTQLGLGISGLVNKLISFTTALQWYLGTNKDSSTSDTPPAAEEVSVREECRESSSVQAEEYKVSWF